MDRVRGVDLSKCSALILSAHTTCHGTRWHTGISDIPGSKRYRYPIFSYVVLEFSELPDKFHGTMFKYNTTASFKVLSY